MRVLYLFLITALAAHAEWIPLWQGDAPGAEVPAAGSEVVRQGGRITHVEKPAYRLFPAGEGKRTGQAVVIFPGGGYGFLASQHEGVEYAEWLNERGITAMVVKYRVSGRDALGYHWPVPYLDARRAIRTLRAMSRNLGITSVGVMGSSAGGHLASLCATHFEATFPEEAGDSLENVSCRPDFAILIYPVISMGEVAHEGSRRRLAGPDPSPERLEFLSTELQVGKDSPPCFLLSTFDDGVDCRNSLKFAAACKASGVPVVLHLFEKGGHGYGLRGEGDVAGWPGLLGRWLQLRAGKASSSKK